MSVYLYTLCRRERTTQILPSLLIFPLDQFEKTTEKAAFVLKLNMSKTPYNEIVADSRGFQSFTAEERRFLESNWWGSRLRTFLTLNSADPDKGREEFKEVIMNDATSWTVFAALLMTTSFACLVVSPSNYAEQNGDDANKWAMYIYVGLFTLAGALSICAAYSGISTYNYFNSAPAHYLEVAIVQSKAFFTPSQFATPAIYATFLGLWCLVYLIFGLTCALASLLSIGVGCVLLIIVDSTAIRASERLKVIISMQANSTLNPITVATSGDRS
jgi:hypothetical protein